MPKGIKLFVCDIDGTMTDGMMTYDHAGQVSKSYHTHDVTGLYMLQSSGIEVVMVTGSRHECDRHRFEFLSRPGLVFNEGQNRPLEHVLIQGVHNKVAVINSVVERLGISWDEVAMIGDAENDYHALRRVGWSACPNDALHEIRRGVDHVMHKSGGRGAVREFAELILTTMARLEGAVA